MGTQILCVIKDSLTMLSAVLTSGAHLYMRTIFHILVTAEHLALKLGVLERHYAFYIGSWVGISAPAHVQLYLPFLALLFVLARS